MKLKRALTGLATTGAVVLALLSPAEAAMSLLERQTFDRVNVARVRHGVRPVQPGWRLRRAAEAHSVRMANAGRIFHGGTWRFGGRRCFGQNVGVGPSLWRMFEAFMRSPAHRANFLNPCFRYAGVGIVERAGYYWVTVNLASPP